MFDVRKFWKEKGYLGKPVCCGGTTTGRMCGEFRGLKQGPGMMRHWLYCWRHMPKKG